jgi:molybdate transport system regulatory protein
MTAKTVKTAAKKKTQTSAKATATAPKVPTNEIQLQADVWLQVNGEKFGGTQRIALLAAVAECGSITQAAKNINMSYKAAWDAIEQMNNLAGEPLLERSSGGKGGGGTHLTTRGQQLVDNFKLIEREHHAYIARLNQPATGLADEMLLIKKMNMKTSIRNQYRGIVSQIKTGAVNDEIEIQIAGKQTLIAIITHDSTEELALAVGAEVFALVSASSVILMDAKEEAKLSARNRLTGKITRIQIGAVNTDISIALPGGAVLSAVITNESCAEMVLKKGQKVTGLFKASAVILGVPA